MPVTRSQGKSYAEPRQETPSASAIHHQLPPRSPSSIEQLAIRPTVTQGAQSVPGSSAATRRTRSKENSETTVKPSDSARKIQDEESSRAVPMTTRGDARNEQIRSPSDQTEKFHEPARLY